MLVDLAMVSQKFDVLVVITLFLDTGWFDYAIYFKIVIMLPMIVIPRSFTYSFVKSVVYEASTISSQRQFQLHKRY